MKINNANSLPKRYFGLHMVPGVAYYAEHEAMVYVSPQVAEAMNQTLMMKPIFVLHVDDYDVKDLEREADGYVIRSFFNEADGAHWCEFIAITDAAQQAIEQGWVLSNSYLIKEEGASGSWHDVPFDIEVIRGEYDHIAVVNNPRYKESVVMTPEQFKEYCEKKRAERLKIANSKGDSMSKFTFFKRQKIEKLDNSGDIESLIVTLPKSKLEKTITQLVNESDEAEMKKGEKKYVSESDMVKVGEAEMTVKELLTKFQSMSDEEAKRKAEEIEEEADDLADHETEEIAEEDEELADELDNESDKDEGKKEDKKQNSSSKGKGGKSKEHFMKLKNAHKDAVMETGEEFVLRSAQDQIKRAKELF